MFHLSNASFSHGSLSVLHDITLDIVEDEKVALVGPSGAGKSSLLSLLWQQKPEQVALCPQESGLVDILSVYQNIYMGGLSRFSTLYNVFNLIRPWASRKRDIAAICQQLGLSDKLFVSPDKLSGGQRQRVALGRALYRQQPIFMGDEPVSSLDPEQGDSLLSEVLARHSTAIVAIHSPEFAIKHFDRVIALQKGRIIGDWPTTDISVATLEDVYRDA